MKRTAWTALSFGLLWALPHCDELWPRIAPRSWL